MNKKILWLLILSLIGFGASYYIFGLDLTAGATGDFLVRLGKALFYGAGALFVIFVILYLLPQAFNAWKKFAVWFVPLAALLFIFYPNPGSGDYLSPYPEQVFQWVSALYVIISLFIIARAALSKK